MKNIVSDLTEKFIVPQYRKFMPLGTLTLIFFYLSAHRFDSRGNEIAVIDMIDDGKPP